jgi:ATP-independent RNA helicase DbpA
MNNKPFSHLNLTRESLKNLETLGYKSMTQIQEKALPLILEGNDIIAKAKTGSGKTATFGLGVINNLDSSKFRIQALILCPTRELSLQVAQNLQKLVRYIHNIKILNLVGGMPYKPQVHSLSHQAHIIVGTPGRVLKHLNENNFSTQDINTFVLDEADKMIDMGFYEDIMSIVSHLPQKRQNMLFSATFEKTLEDLSKKTFNDPIVVQVEQLHQTNTIMQTFYETSVCDKFELTSKLFDTTMKSVIIFCNTKLVCDQLADYLEDNYEFISLVLHSDYEQPQRDETLILFDNKSYPVLIATDVASRGLDIENVDMVVNFDMPQDVETYVHRIGRTARASNNGKVISFVEENIIFEDIQEHFNESFELTNPETLKNKQAIFPSYDYSTLYINGGKRHKLRAGDILGTLIQGVGLSKEDIGKISILPTCSYVAIKNKVYEKAFKELQNTKMKNRFFRVFKR